MNDILTSFIKKRKTTIIIIFMAFLGIILVFSGSKDSPQKENETSNSNNDSSYAYELENKLEELINNISGVSGVNVMITLESGNEYVYASDDTELAQKHVIVDDGLVCVTEKYPKIKGVAVVCKGGENSVIKTKITELVCSVLGIYSTSVYVTE